MARVLQITPSKQEFWSALPRVVAWSVRSSHLGIDQCFNSYSCSSSKFFLLHSQNTAVHFLNLFPFSSSMVAPICAPHRDQFFKTQTLSAKCDWLSSTGGASVEQKQGEALERLNSKLAKTLSILLHYLSNLDGSCHQKEASHQILFIQF